MGEWCLPCDYKNCPPAHLRVTDSFSQDGLLEVVDATLTSRSPKAQETEILAKIILTREEVRWLRDTLSKVLGEEAVTDVGEHVAKAIAREIQETDPESKVIDPAIVQTWAGIANSVLSVVKQHNKDKVSHE